MSYSGKWTLVRPEIFMILDSSETMTLDSSKTLNIWELLTVFSDIYSMTIVSILIDKCSSICSWHLCKICSKMIIQQGKF